MKRFEYETHTVKDRLLRFLNKKGAEGWQMVGFDRNPHDGTMVRIYLMRERQVICATAKDCWKDRGCHHRQPHTDCGACTGPCPQDENAKCVPYTGGQS